MTRARRRAFFSNSAIAAYALLAGCAAEQSEADDEGVNQGSEISLSEQALTASRSNILASSPEDHDDMVYYLQERARNVRKSVDLPSGQSVDCVDVSKQKALRGSKPELAPSDRTATQATRGGGSQHVDGKGLEGSDACDPGTIPVLRVKLETLEQFGSLKNFNSKFSPLLLPAIGDETHEYATTDKFVSNNGSSAALNLWSPFTAGTGEEMTLSQLWISRGAGSDLQTVEAGWQKYQDKYGDWRAHLFIFYTPDGYDSGCYNLDCTAFVQTDNTITLGGGFDNYSVTDGAQYHVELKWHRDTNNGNWWLQYGTKWVGYYPASLFDSAGIRNGASRATFGGENGWFLKPQHTATDMGSGAFPSQGFAKAAFTRAIKYRDSGGTWQNATGMSTNVTNRHCYNLSLSSSADAAWGNYFYFGGSGFNANCP